MPEFIDCVGQLYRIAAQLSAAGATRKPAAKAPTPILPDAEQLLLDTRTMQAEVDRLEARLSAVTAARESRSSALTPEQLKICEETGCSPEQFAQTKKAINWK